MPIAARTSGQKAMAKPARMTRKAASRVLGPGRVGGYSSPGRSTSVIRLSRRAGAVPVALLASPKPRSICDFRYPPIRADRRASPTGGGVTGLCGDALGTPWGDQKPGKQNSDDRSGSFRIRPGDRAAELTHEDGHVVGTALLRNFRNAPMLHA